MRQKKPSVFIVILNYKNYIDTIRCLESLRQSDYENARIVVVDNDSQNKSLESIAHALDDWEQPYQIHKTPPGSVAGDEKHILVQSGANRGYAAGNNVGIRLALDAGADYVVILNNDTIIPLDFPGRLVTFAESRQDAGIVSPNVLDSAGKRDRTCARRRLRFWDNLFVLGIPAMLFPQNRFIRRRYYMDYYDFYEPMKVDIVSGSCMLLKSDCIREIGLLDEGTFLMNEEPILCERIAPTRFETYLYPESTITHLHGKSISQESRKWMGQVSAESARYYLKRYRCYGKIRIALAMFLRWRPRRQRASGSVRKVQHTNTA